MMLLSIEIVHALLSSIALPDILHEVSIIHGVSHLSVVIVLSLVGALRAGKATNSRLVEHLFLVHLSIYMRQHFMNS